MLKTMVAIGIWVTRFQMDIYLENGKPKTFGSYQQAWQFISDNNLPLGASAIEIYQST